MKKIAFVFLFASTLCAQVQLGKGVQVGGSSAGGNGITSLSGDISATGPGATTATLPAVSSSSGTCGDATHVCIITTNPKGLVTAQSQTLITSFITSITTTGSSGPATVSSGVLNIPQYSGSGSLPASALILGTDSLGHALATPFIGTGTSIPTWTGAQGAGNLVSTSSDGTLQDSGISPGTLVVTTADNSYVGTNFFVGDTIFGTVTAATSGANHNSPNINIYGTFWDGSSSAIDAWQWQDVMGTGTNPIATLTLTHSASTTPALSIPYPITTGALNAPSYGGTGSTQTVVNFTQGSAAATPPANTVQIGAPLSVPNSYSCFWPSLPPTDSGGDVPVCPAGGGTMTWQAYSGGGTTYINTTFNEAGSGNLAGTTPATCANGCVGPWTLASGTDFAYQSGGGILATTTNTNYDLINTGQTNETIRFNVGSISTASLLQVVVRFTDMNNFTVLNICDTLTGNCGGANGYALLDVVGGSATQIGSTIASTPTGNYTVVLSGTGVTVDGPTGVITGTLANTGTTTGFAFRTGSSVGISSFSAKSN